MRGADGEGVQGVARRKDAAQQRRLEPVPHCSQASGVGVVRGIGGDRELVGVVTRTDDEQQIVRVGEPVQQAPDGAHSARECSRLRANGQVHNPDARRCGRLVPLAFHNPSDCAVKDVGEQTIWDYLLVSRHELVGLQDRSYVERTIKRWTAISEVAVNDE